MVASGAPPVKPLVWMGSSKKDLVALPASVVDVFGYGLISTTLASPKPRNTLLFSWRACISEEIQVWRRHTQARYGIDPIATQARCRNR